MNEAPERIQAWMQPHFSEIGSWSTTRYPAVTIEYVRADLYAKLEADLASANARADVAFASGIEAAAIKATSFLVGDPKNDIPLRNPMAHEIAAAILALIQKEKDDE